MGKIILASQSPRRQEIMSLGGYAFEVRVSLAEEQISEDELQSLSPEQLVERLARIKAEDVWMHEATQQNQTIIGADTVVAIDGQVLGKPKNKEDAVNMLTQLSGRSHDVFTGVCILWVEDAKAKEIQGTTFHCQTKVTFYPMTEEEIQEYVASGDCMDKAGAYGIQSGAAKYIHGIEGDYLNVVGLPLSKIYHVLGQKISDFTIKMEV